MLPAIIQFKLAMGAMTGWMAAAGPAPVPVATLAVMMEARVVEPIEVPIFDENHANEITVVIGRDGGTDLATTGILTHVFRCKRTDHEHRIAAATLGLIANVADHYRTDRAATIVLVSGYRAWAEESATSPHRAARAVDFRLRTVPMGELRDYLWRNGSTFGSVGVGWYPGEGFLHIDSRPGVPDIAWTALHHHTQYHPAWSEAAMVPPDQKRERPSHKPGV